MRQGTGLGMTLVRRIVDAMGGAIAVESLPGRGTTLRLTLPMPLAEGPAAPGEAALPRAAAARLLEGRTAVIADDVGTNRLVLGAYLERLGMRVLAAADGPTAVEHRLAAEPDLVVLDLSMPVMDGVATLRAIRERERERGLRAVPALAITAHPLSGRGRHLAAEGFAGALAKPIDGDALADAAARCLPDLPDARA